MKSELIAALKELSYYEKDFYKSRAYNNAVFALLALSEKDLITREDYTDLYGIGSSINSKILEFKSTFSISKLEEYKATMELPKELYKERKGSITKRISYSEATEHIRFLRECLSVDFTVAGSYRRGNSLIGDIDILVDESYYYKCIGRLSKEFNMICSGDYKSSFIIDPINNIQVDIISVNDNNRAFQLLYLTGSKENNIRMRGKAKSMGLRLNQDGLYKGSFRIKGLDTEKLIFKYLDLEYANRV